MLTAFEDQQGRGGMSAAPARVEDA